jgi:ketohexokinase
VADESFFDVFKGRIPDVTLKNIRYVKDVLAFIRCTESTIISVEVEKPEREGLLELAAEADVVFFSRSWAVVSISHLVHAH